VRKAILGRQVIPIVGAKMPSGSRKSHQAVQGQDVAYDVS